MNTGRNMKKVAFIYPGIVCIGYNSYERSLDSSDSEHIYAFSVLASVIEKHGFDFELIDMRQLSGEDELVDRLSKTDAGFAAITVQTPSFDIACKVANLARTAGLITVGGGVHATVAPEDFLSCPDWDYVVAGEGEVAFPQLLNQILEGTRPHKLVSGQILKNLDDLPLPHMFPEWDKKYQTLYGIELSRGCPARCTFCVSGEKRFYKKMRFRSIDHSIREIEYAYAKHKFSTLLFLNVYASANKKWFIAFLRELLRKHSHLNIITQERVDGFDEQVAELLSQFRSCLVWFGFESASPRILKFINKNTNLEEAKKSADLCLKYKLKIGANVLIGIPTETEEDMQTTYDFMKNHIRPDLLFCNILSPFPGTEIYNYCRKHNLLPEPISSEKYEIRSVLENGFINGMDYTKVRYWHRRFNKLLSPEARPLWRRKLSWILDYRIGRYLHRTLERV